MKKLESLSVTFIAISLFGLSCYGFYNGHKIELLNKSIKQEIQSFTGLDSGIVFIDEHNGLFDTSSKVIVSFKGHNDKSIDKRELVLNYKINQGILSTFNSEDIKISGNLRLQGQFDGFNIKPKSSITLASFESHYKGDNLLINGEVEPLHISFNADRLVKDVDTSKIDYKFLLNKSGLLESYITSDEIQVQGVGVNLFLSGLSLYNKSDFGNLSDLFLNTKENTIKIRQINIGQLAYLSNFTINTKIIKNKYNLKLDNNISAYNLRVRDLNDLTLNSQLLASLNISDNTNIDDLQVNIKNIELRNQTSLLKIKGSLKYTNLYDNKYNISFSSIGDFTPILKTYYTDLTYKKVPKKSKGFSFNYNGDNLSSLFNGKE